MAKLVFGAALLFAFVNVSVPVYAQSVYLQVCNAGKVDIDVFVSRAGNVSSSHVGSADCATVAESAGAMGAAYVGLALVDAHGQWGAARRLDVLPVRGSGAWSRAVFGGLPTGSARRMAEELFIADLDATKIKTEIYQTKFWPKYSRDTVRSKGSGHASSSGGSESVSATSTDIFSSGESALERDRRSEESGRC